MSNTEKIGTANGFSKSCTVRLYQAVIKLLVKRPSYNEETQGLFFLSVDNFYGPTDLYVTVI